MKKNQNGKELEKRPQRFEESCYLIEPSSFWQFQQIE